MAKATSKKAAKRADGETVEIVTVTYVKVRFFSGYTYVRRIVRS